MFCTKAIMIMFIKITLPVQCRYNISSLILARQLQKYLGKSLNEIDSGALLRKNSEMVLKKHDGGIIFGHESEDL